MLTDCRMLFGQVSTELEFLDAILRTSACFGNRFLFDAALQRLALKYPMTLAGWDKCYGASNATFGMDPVIDFGAVGLRKVLGLDTLLPAMYYRIVLCGGESEVY